MSDQPLVPLILLLVALVVILQILRPGIVNERWIANTIKFAIPLAILAGCQTMTMLTGGIDLSVSTVATMARLHHGDAGRQPRSGRGDPDRAGAGRADRAGQRHRRRRLPRASADHDARHQPRRQRLPAGLPAHGDRLRHQDPRRPGLAGHRPHLRRPQRAAAVRAAGGADHLHAAPDRIRAPALRRRRQ